MSSIYKCRNCPNAEVDERGILYCTRTGLDCYEAATLCKEPEYVLWMGRFIKIERFNNDNDSI